MTIGLRQTNNWWVVASLTESSSKGTRDIVVDDDANGAGSTCEGSLKLEGTGASGDEGDFANEIGRVVSLCMLVSDDKVSLR